MQKNPEEILKEFDKSIKETVQSNFSSLQSIYQSKINNLQRIVNELKIPLIDERVYDSVKFNTGSAVAAVIFKFEEDESVIRGFLGLAEYFHTVVIKRKERKKPGEGYRATIE